MGDIVFRLVLAVVVGLGCALAGYCWRAMETSRRQRDSGADEQAGADMDRHSAAQRAGEIASQRRGLIMGLIRAHDLSDTDQARVHIGRVLHSVGVSPIQPGDNEMLDESRHTVIERVRTDGYAGDRQIARLDRIGWCDREGVLRRAEVSIWSTGSFDDRYGGR